MRLERIASPAGASFSGGVRNRIRPGAGTIFGNAALAAGRTDDAGNPERPERRPDLAARSSDGGPGKRVR